MRKFVLFSAFCLFSVNCAFGAWCFWQDTNGDLNSWADVEEWTTTFLPGPDDGARIGYSSYSVPNGQWPVVDSVITATPSQVRLGETADGEMYIVPGGSLEVVNWFGIGFPGYTGQLYMTGGYLKTGTNLNLGQDGGTASLIVSGGQIEVLGTLFIPWLTGNGTLELNDGDVSCVNLAMESSGLIDIESGTLTVDRPSSLGDGAWNSYKDQLEGYIDDGLIRGYGNAGNSYVNISYDDVNRDAFITSSQPEKTWFNNDKFGMFIHWGPSNRSRQVWIDEIGVDPGSDYEPLWVLFRETVPVADYENLGPIFNPVNFDASYVISLARQAGMKYVVPTAKHHDGFALFDTAVSTWDTFDATPWDRDWVRELASACQAQDFRMGFYYSHAKDWHHPHGVDNDWDFDPNSKDFSIYFNEKCKPQVQELIQNYGDINLIWFDTPAGISYEQSNELYNLVKQDHPDCMINSRLGNGPGDYLSLGDKQIPECFLNGPWETAATLTSRWGYHPDITFEDTDTLVEMLCSAVGRGGNLLLNINLTELGDVPQTTVDRLEDVGQWMDKHSQAIYGTDHNPYLYAFVWGTITVKDSKMYLLFFDWPGTSFTLNGLRNTVTKAYVLSDSSQTPLNITQSYNPVIDHDALTISSLPVSEPYPWVSVVVLELDGPANVDTLFTQQNNSPIKLNATAFEGDIVFKGYIETAKTANHAHIHSPYTSPMVRIDRRAENNLENWTDPNEWVSWDFKVIQPGIYDVEVIQALQRIIDANGNRSWITDVGHSLTVEVAGRILNGVLHTTGGKIGQIYIPNPGIYTLKLKPDYISTEKGLGLTLEHIKLSYTSAGQRTQVYKYLSSSASNVFNNSSGYSSDKAFDNSHTTRWATDYGIYNAWLQINFVEPITFDQVRIDEFGDRISSFRLEYKDGTQWIPFHTGTTIGEQAIINVSETTAQKIRLNVLDCSDDGPSVWEMQFWGILNLPYEDINNDYMVDMSDLAILSNNWLEDGELSYSPGGVAGHPTGDLNTDHQIDFLDFAILANGLSKSKNLIPDNPEFENDAVGDPVTGWFKDTVIVAGDNGPSEPGSKSAYMAAGTDDYGLRSKGFWVNSGAGYVVNFDYKTANSTSGNPEFRFVFADDATIDEIGNVNGNFIGQKHLVLLPTGGNWETVSVTAAGYNGTNLAAYIRFTKNKFGSFDGEVYIDNVRVYEQY